MICPPYGYCMCVHEPRCTYPDCRVGDMLASDDDRQPSVAGLESPPALVLNERAPWGRALAAGLIVSLLLWGVIAGGLVWWW